MHPSSDVATAAANLMFEERADVVVVKRGLDGVLIVDADGSRASSAYRSGPGANLIGSGDVFSAVFAQRWFEGIAPDLAADEASRRVANYVGYSTIDAVADPMPTEALLR